MLTVRELAEDDLPKVHAIDMTERGNKIYTVAGGELLAVPEDWERPPRTQETWDRFVGGWRVTLQRGGAAWGAFDGDVMVGIAVLRRHLTSGMDQLSALFVSRPHRRLGVAGRLVHEVVEASRAGGAHALYVSATPSPSAIGFYLRQGFGLAETVNDELYALEPKDIHMILKLS